MNNERLQDMETLIDRIAELEAEVENLNILNRFHKAAVVQRDEIIDGLRGQLVDRETTHSALNRRQEDLPHVGRIAHAGQVGGILQRESTLNIDDLTLGEAKALVRQLLPLIEGVKATPPDAEGADLPERAVLVTTVHRGVFFGYLR